MDPLWWRTFSYVVVFVGTALVLFGSIGTWYFGNLVESVMPYRQPIHTASATVEVIVAADQSIDTHYMDRGGYLVLAKGQEAILTVAASDSHARQLGDGRIRYRGVFVMDANDKAAGKPVRYVREADYAQIFFHKIPKESKVLSGKAVCTLNSSIRFEISVPEQETKEGALFARNLEGVFSAFK